MKKLYLLLLLTLFGIFTSFAQTIDESFVKPIPYKSAKTNVIKELPDGKILLGGIIDFYKDKKVNNLIRLNPDYSLDETFVFSGDANSEIKDVKFQSNGNIIVLTTRDNFGIPNYFKLYQLGVNGEIIKEVTNIFNATSIAIQPDDKILVTGGAIGYYTFTSCFLNRYNSDFSLDETFNNNLAFNASTNSVVVSTNGIYVGGTFSAVDGIAKNSLVKLNSDGIIDESFDIGENINGTLFSLTLQDDGKLIIGASFLRMQGQPTYNMCRLNPDGTVDTTFNSIYQSFQGSAVTIKDSDIYIAMFEPAEFNSYLVKLNPDGSLNKGFSPLPLDENGQLFFQMSIIGDKILYNNSGHFNNKYGLSVSDLSGNAGDSPEIKPTRYGSFDKGENFDGKLVVKGDFMKVNNVETFGIALLNENGSVDESFVFPKYPGEIKQFQVIDNSTIFVSTKNKLLKLNNKGEVLKDFVLKNYTQLFGIEKFKVLDNGKILITDQWILTLLDPAGQPEKVYKINSDTYFWFTGLTFELQDNKIILGAMYNDFSETPHLYKLLRFNLDASLDETFKVNGSGPDTSVEKIKILDTGEIILAGGFLNFNGVSVPNQIVKLSKNGEMDMQFNQNQETGKIGISTNHDFRKIEQLGSVIYITEGDANVTAINLDGTFVTNFELPVQMDQVSDIVALEEKKPLQTDKFKAKSKSSDSDNYIFAIGSSKNTASFVVKVNVGKSSGSLSTNPTPEKLSSNVQVYPVPVSNTMSLSFSDSAAPTKIAVYSLNGTELLSSQIQKKDTIEVDMSRFSPGVYFIKVFSDSGVSTKKIIKR